MNDTLITFETAKLAKEKNFNITINAAYDENGLLRICCPDFYLRGYHNQGLASLAPSQSLLQKWLGEEHGIWLSIHLNPLSSSHSWMYSLLRYDNGTLMNDEHIIGITKKP